MPELLEKLRPMNQTRVTLLAIAVTTLVGCSAQLRNTTPDGVPISRPGSTLPRPQRVVVVGFALDRTQVRLDRGIGARLQRQIGTSDADAQQSALADAVQTAASDTLVGDLSRMGFAAERARSGDTPRPGDLIVAGEIVSVDQGNRTRRLALGFGAGASQVRAAIRVYLVGPDFMSRLLQTYSAEADSGRKPGLVLGGAGALGQASAVPLAASSALGIGGEVRAAGGIGEGQRLAHRVAQELGQFFAAQGWTEPGRMPPS